MHVVILFTAGKSDSRQSSEFQFICFVTGTRCFYATEEMPTVFTRKFQRASKTINKTSSKLEDSRRRQVICLKTPLGWLTTHSNN